MPTPATLIVNTRSRKGRKLFSHAKALLARAGIPLEAAFSIDDPNQLVATTQRALDQGSTLVIVGGGDGTMSAIVDLFVGREAVLGLLPLGTSNNFITRTLGIPGALEGAVDVIANGVVTDVDLGLANGDYFANTASIGLTADIARSTPRWLKRWIGPLAYGVIGLRNLLQRERFTCTITLPTGTHTVHTHQVIIANGNFFGMTRVAPDHHVDSGKILIFTMETLNRWQMARAWIAFFFGRTSRITRAHSFITHEATIKTEPPQYMNIDGEISGQTPATFTVARNALRVMAPRHIAD